MTALSLQRNVLIVVYDPRIPSAGDRPLSATLGWNDASRLARDFIGDLRQASHGICNYQIAGEILLEAFPAKVDGFRYTADSFMRSWRARHGFHTPDWADYHVILEETRAVEWINDGRADEVWLFAFPYGGFYESRMAGPGAFWCNAPPLGGFKRSDRRFVIMGFNYERGVGEMLESYGHRAESIMSQVYKDRRVGANLWERFCRTHYTHPNEAEVGTIHFAPNSRHDYEWNSRVAVPSRCDSWFNFPDLSGPSRLVDSREWGDGDIRKHHLWWFGHLPHFSGVHDGLLQNWWAYIVDPNDVSL